MGERINVRTVAEFYYEGGSLTSEAGLFERMQEGARAHRALQSLYPEGHQSEVPLSLTLTIDGLTLDLYGRMDGFWLEDGLPVVEEIKTTLGPVDALGEDAHPVHWAQAQLYAAMLCALHGYASARVQLVYQQLSGDMVRFSRSYDAAALDGLMHTYLTPLVRWLNALRQHRLPRLESMGEAVFPFERFRAGQREMSVNTYIALRDKKCLLCQAPTGIGKTAASLFPAVKALGEERIDRIFYLTARGTGALAVSQALERMRKGGLFLRAVTLIAKAKICPVDGQVCDGCPRAEGYYDRLRDALYESLFTDTLSTEHILRLAEKYSLCPFELSLDLAETADLVICDYNYVFDPRVRLQRFFTGKSDAALLIDEAHNLPSRAQEMLSAPLELERFELLRRAVGHAFSRTHPLYKSFKPLIESFRALRALHEEAGAVPEKPDGLCAAVQDWVTEAAPYWDADTDCRAELQTLYFAALDFLAASERWDEHYLTLLEPTARHIRVTLWCADPSSHIRAALSRVHGAVLFSATLSPLPFYRDLLGLSEEKGDALLDLPSPFPPENLTVRRVRLPLRYRQREAAVEPLCRELIRAVEGQKGNFLVCMPSYGFLRTVYEALDAMHPDIRLFAQAPDMTEFARLDFLAQFRPAPDGPMLAFIVMGGVFAEGVDLPGDLLSGAFIVGTGVPQVNPKNDALRALYEERFGAGCGYRYAYLYPGLTRVLQAAGRVIRTETDRGLVELIDTRWFDPEHVSLLPPHWQLQ